MENIKIVNEDKRGAPRVQNLFMIAYLPFGDEPIRTPVSLGRTVDISQSGVGMEVYKEVAVGTVMEMEIDLEGLPVSAWGKVVHVDLLDNGNFRIGIRFDEEQELLQIKIAMAQVLSLRQRVDELEKVLAVLVRTGWPWEGADQPGKILSTGKNEFVAAIHEARKLLGRAQRSLFNRTKSKI